MQNKGQTDATLTHSAWRTSLCEHYDSVGKLSRSSYVGDQRPIHCDPSEQRL